MTKRFKSTVRLGWIQALLGIVLMAIRASAAHSAEQRNFIVILGEAQGWASASVQMEDAVPDSKSRLARTPNLESLARAGMRFSNFYAAAPRCTPTRAALLAGRSPAALHMTFVGEGRGGRESGFSATGSRLLPAPFVAELPVAETTIASLLKRAGYTTAHFGKWHLGRINPAQYGFDESDGPTNNGGPENVENPNPKEAFGLTERGIDFMVRQAKAGKPFYLQLSHYPGRGGTDARPETYEDVRKRSTGERDVRQVGAAAVTEDMDASIGMLVAKLDELRLANRTYILYTSDHGAQGRNANGPLADGKGTIWEGGIRVPLIVRGPGVRAGGSTETRASTVDIFPTIGALAGVTESLPVAIEGGSLVPILTGRPQADVQRSLEEFVVHMPHYDKDGQRPASAIFVGRYKLIHSYETGMGELFDVTKDPGERWDLSGESPQVAAELEQRLKGYLKSVNAQMPTPNPGFHVLP